MRIESGPWLAPTLRTLAHFALAAVLWAVFLCAGCLCQAADAEARAALALASAVRSRAYPPPQRPEPPPQRPDPPPKRCRCSAACTCGCNAGGECGCDRLPLPVAEKVTTQVGIGNVASFYQSGSFLRAPAATPVRC